MATTRQRIALAEPPWVRGLLIATAVAFLALLLLLPLAAVLAEAFRRGLAVYWAAVSAPEARSAIRLTLIAVAFSLGLNVAFGLSAAWAIAKFRFRGKQVLITLIDLPFAISPVVIGLLIVLLYGARGWLGPWLDAHAVRVVFALPGVVLATTFVTFPFVARELIPHMQALGSEHEEAALSLGASGWQTFRRVTLPSIRWSLLYGVILCNARAMGEFGAVSVVSGRIRGETTTLPLHIEILYNEYQFSAAFAVASLLVGLALITLVAKTVVEWRSGREQEQST